ncbi:hypothetical protein [Tautonia rosea]|uniref:hypothetical protein n=1 Tax=Tautonia rosea TaxID=2728037 RepID=UPI00147368B7|nr:hypothetical protein [Tautonia rosea]
MLPAIGLSDNRNNNRSVVPRRGVRLLVSSACVLTVGWHWRMKAADVLVPLALPVLRFGPALAEPVAPGGMMGGVGSGRPWESETQVGLLKVTRSMPMMEALVVGLLGAVPGEFVLPPQGDPRGGLTAEMDS